MITKKNVNSPSLQSPISRALKRLIFLGVINATVCVLSALTHRFTSASEGDTDTLLVSVEFFTLMGCLVGFVLFAFGALGLMIARRSYEGFICILMSLAMISCFMLALYIDAKTLVYLDACLGTCGVVETFAVLIHDVQNVASSKPSCLV